MAFTHLHVHSEYSLLDGLIKIDDLVTAVKEQGQSSVALTDHGALYGAYRFYTAAKNAGIKPIIGVETYKAAESRFDKKSGERDQFHLVLLAKNYTGYKNLIKLVTMAHLEGYYYKPRIDFELLEKYGEGIIALSGCLNSEINTQIRHNQPEKAEAILKKYMSVFKDNFYIELQRYNNVDDLELVNKTLVEFSRKFGIPLVATNDVHYLKKEDAYAQEILLCIQTQHSIHEKNRPLSMIETPEFYLRTEVEMREIFSDYPEALDNTQKVANLCNVEIPSGTWIVPNYPLPKGKTSSDHLMDLILERVGGRNLDMKDPLIKQRIDYEFDVISTKGYATYFLIVADFVNWSKDHGIAVGPGRGSVAGSIISYILRITDINPLDYNLPFERFLTVDRPTPPDIDIDFADTRRDEVLAYVTEKYGSEKVAQIITFGRMEARLAVRDVTRALGYSYSLGDRIAKMIPLGKQGFAMTIERAIDENPPLKIAYQTEIEVKKILDIARKVEGLARHSSVHAAGVIIADKDLTEYVPLQREAKGDRIITQYDMYCLDLNAVSNGQAIGLMKMDFLGLRNLTILENAIKFVEQTQGEKIDIHTVPLDDKKTYDLIASGRTVGVFQLESGGMRKLAKDLIPTKMTDISAMVALYRPGPMDLIPSFLEGKKNPSKIKYLHQDLKETLEETYGVLVYQEQVMEIAHKLAGFTLSEADTFRMAIGKKKKALMKVSEAKFREGALNNGYSQAVVDKIYGFIEKFAAYGFNKAHSASYALIAYWTGYMKANYPVEYMTSLLSAELQGSAGGVRELKMMQAIDECRALEITVLPPNINKSSLDFSIEGGVIRFGLSAIKNVGDSAIESIVEIKKVRNFSGLKDFLLRVDTRKVNKKTVESLIKAGAFDAFGNRIALLSYYPAALEEVNREKKGMESGQFSLFTSKETKKYIDELPEESKDTSEYIAMEREVLGFSVDKNPLSQFESIIRRKVNKKIGEITGEDVGKSVIVAGSIGRVKIVTTKKNNNKMAFVSVFDETGSIEMIIFPKLFDTTKEIWKANGVVLLKGKVDAKDDDLTVLIENAVDLEKVSRN
ncbi:DNA polymerase III subunit alpha [Candidatus Roizmanbacteria bacterium RIFCSPHIGHO2_02_FULL_40_13b]|uniref:DNA polymerase III subunit alpha n=1 Tax=Candidatus Roizmanbacteria bacterium RIFCSPHIGHO2_01_FULL_39_24 TaxID=1802032 RepID=A0A1F7GFG5_9BACT|nr:MAG: DNA polymerase III subunit alpha [Candidatus Roizmanbacteria bacterium RIFCSPHIGHO2_01_FULL_39_24]OGK26427.1 MAG: DNA polymerase III subunit alpha [Candidatus Roizmanbacteria bacterium RIFCSPHIGHO2_02_FULL_40_13b]OGK49039.1 MAG: DNA polymerase III subunit alpha [Candidatus Roizmanbacteria bacterium RIFCSPLOWO2_01_FULL_40_32]